MKILEYNDKKIYFEPTSKFKTVLIGVIFSNELKVEDLAKRALLAKVMKKKTEKYPSEQALLHHLQNLYDMKFASFISRRGLVSSMCFFIDSVNSKYLEDKINLLDESFIFLNEVLNKPYLVDGKFDEGLLERERRLVIDDINRIYNNKALYATDKLVQHMFSNEKYHYRLSGELEDVKEVTLNDLNDAYDDLLNNSVIELFVIGDVTEEEVMASVAKLQLPPGKKMDLQYLDTETKEELTGEEIIEEQEINQSKLCIGYRSEIRYIDDLYYPMLVFNGVFGRYFHSRLFQSVRAQHSLAYYINTSYDERKGSIILTSGINNKDYLKTVSLISKELESIKEGNISDEEMETTKKAIINEIWKNDDNQFGMFGEILVATENVPLKTIEEKVELINKVTKEQVVECAKRLMLDTIFLLKGTSENNGEGELDEEDNE
jgi:predicted Zn-dependent peptidase